MQFLVGVINQNVAITEMAAVQQENKVNHHILYKKINKEQQFCLSWNIFNQMSTNNPKKTTTKEKATLLPEAQICFEAHSILVENFQLNVLITYRETKPMSNF